MILWKRIVQVLLMSTVVLIADTGLKNPFLWEVTKASEKFYFFGTIHLLDKNFRTLPDVIKKVIDKSDEVRTEVSMYADFQVKSATYMMRDTEESLQMLLPVKLYTRLENYLKSINPQLSLYPFESMKVWGLSVVIMMLENQLKNPGLEALDAHIYNYAKETGKGVGGVETIEEQMSAMDKFTLKEQIDDLETTLDYLIKHKDFIEKMKSIYREGNSKKMMAFLEEMMFTLDTDDEMEEKFMKIMLYDRNKKMTARIVENLISKPKSTYLFAFGVMHFLGEKSIITEFEAKGYSVRRLK